MGLTDENWSKKAGVRSKWRDRGQLAGVVMKAAAAHSARRGLPTHGTALAAAGEAVMDAASLPRLRISEAI